jgi:hypothetical protein
MVDDSKSRLDRIGRDLSRTLLHGSRVANNGQSVPLTVATGQQIQVDLPDQGGMRFQFTAGVSNTTVPIDRTQASNSQDYMTDALSVAGRLKYMTLNVANDVPTWTFGQRSFSVAN